MLHLRNHQSRNCSLEKKYIFSCFDFHMHNGDIVRCSTSTGLRPELGFELNSFGYFFLSVVIHVLVVEQHKLYSSLLVIFKEVIIKSVTSL